MTIPTPPTWDEAVERLARYMEWEWECMGFDLLTKHRKRRLLHRSETALRAAGLTPEHLEVARAVADMEDGSMITNIEGAMEGMRYCYHPPGRRPGYYGATLPAAVAAAKEGEDG